MQAFAPAIAANRFGLGARPGDWTHIGSDPAGWLNAQLVARPPVLTAEGLQGSQEIIAQSLDLRREIRAARKSGDTAAAEAVQRIPQLFRPAYVAEATARFAHAATTDRAFIERLTQFWSNHFAVSVDKVAVLGVAGALEREAIRPHVLGNFTDLLLAVEQHPAMLLYLDNHISVGPHSTAARVLDRRNAKHRAGINENLAREIMELHTLGVGGGYTQADVTTFAEVITGWSIGGEAGRLPTGEPGRFMFRSELHEPGSKVVLGKRYSDDGVAQGVAVLRSLAANHSTARFIATKLARHFIADEPPAAAVERIARAFVSSGGDLPTVYRALIASPEAWAEPLAKYKTPSDYIISTFRGLELPVGNGRPSLAAFDVMGQRAFSPGSPAGWPDRGDDWNGASALLKRIEWADAVGQRAGNGHNAVELAPQLLGATLTSHTQTSIGHAASAAQALTLLLAAPEFMRR